MGKCQLDGFKIESERDLRKALEEIERRWGRQLSSSAKTFLFNRFSKCFEDVHAQSRECKQETKKLEPSFAEKQTGKSLRELDREHEEQLRKTWKLREREAILGS